MYGSDAGQPVPSLYTKGLSPLCDNMYILTIKIQGHHLLFHSRGDILRMVAGERCLSSHKTGPNFLPKLLLMSSLGKEVVSHKSASVRIPVCMEYGPGKLRAAINLVDG